VEELTDLRILGENIVKEYGVRLTSAITNFVKSHDLEEHVSSHRPKKRLKVESAQELNGDIPENNNHKAGIAKDAAEDFDNDVDPKGESRYF